MKNKIFKCFRHYMLITQQSLLKRMLDESKNNKKIKTYFRFSVGHQTFYFGWYKKYDIRKCFTLVTLINKIYKYYNIHYKEVQKSLTLTLKLDLSWKEKKHDHVGKIRTIFS